MGIWFSDQCLVTGDEGVGAGVVGPQKRLISSCLVWAPA